MTDDDLSPKARDLLTFIAEKGYICPWGSAWHDLWEMLPNKKAASDGGWEPCLPLILSGWYHSSDEDKAFLMCEHIAWADQHGGIDKVDKYLRGLDPQVWHKTGKRD